MSRGSRRRRATRNGTGRHRPGRVESVSRRRRSHRRPGAGASSTADARSSPARSGTSGRSRAAGSLSHLPRRQAPSKLVARTSESARASKCQRYGGKSHDQPTTSPASMRLDRDGAARRHERLERDAAVPEDVEGVGLVAVAEEQLALAEMRRSSRSRRSARAGPASGPGRAARRAGWSQSSPSSAPSLARIAVSSSVTSIPTGHQVMQRPQPTQPELPNWSCQVPNLCVSHWR